MRLLSSMTSHSGRQLTATESSLTIVGGVFSTRLLLFALLACLIVWQSLDNWTSLQHMNDYHYPKAFSASSLSSSSRSGANAGFEAPQQPTIITRDDTLTSAQRVDISATSTTTITSTTAKRPSFKYPPGRQYLEPALRPTLGTHRSNATTAMFAMAKGYDIDDHLITLGSLFYATNYKGDVVIGVQNWKNCSKPLQAFLQYHAEHSNLVVYTLPDCQKLLPYPYDRYGHVRCIHSHAYINPWNGNKPANARNGRKDLSGRHQSPRKFRYEYYWIWQRHYADDAQIWLMDFRDLVFQSNPMDHWSMKLTENMLSPMTLHVFEESELRRITETERFTGKLMQEFYGPQMVQAIGNQTVLCSGITLAGRVAMEQYLLSMMWHMDNILGNPNGKGDQVHHNVLYYLGELDDIQGIESIQLWKNFQGPVATTGYTYRDTGSLGHEPVTDTHGNNIPMVHQYDRSRSLKYYIHKLRATQWQPRAERQTGIEMNAPIIYVNGKPQRKPS